MTLDRRIDVDQLLREVSIADVIGQYAELKPNGDEFKARCPFHDESSPSFYVVPQRGERPAFYHCFGCGAHGSVIDFLVEHQGVSFKEACRRLGSNDLHTSERRPTPIPTVQAVDAWVPVLPVPAEAPPMDTDRLFNPKRGTTIALLPQRSDTYRDGAGRILGYVLRCALPDDRKWTPTVTWCTGPEGQKARWCLKAFQKPRPLLGLPGLAERPDAKVLVVSGERCQAEASELLTGFVTLTWPGGDQGVRHADWAPLAGRDVLLWMDADESGAAAGAVLGAHLVSLGCAVRTLDVSGMPEGWDVADAIAGGWDAAGIRAWALPRIRPWGVPQGGAAEAPATGGKDPSSPVSPESRPRPTRAQAAGAVLRAAQSAAPTGSAYQPPVIPALSPPPLVGTLEPIPAPRRSRVEVAISTTPAEAEASESHPVIWQRMGLACSGSGLPFANLDNAMRVLETDARFCSGAGKPRFWYDTFHARIFTNWAGDKREFGDADVSALAVTLQRDLGLVKFVPELVYQAVMLVASRSPRSEPRDWLESLQWDDENRLDSFLIEAFGAEDTPYTRAASKNFLIAMVARVYNPGCKVDSMVVLEGAQGVGKSKALAALGGSWYAEAHESVTSKDFFQVLQGKMLIEIGELDAFSRAESTRVKQVITCTTDRYRPPYGRAALDFPRQCVFVGTTNEREYLRDSTGGRRFWPVQCTRIDYELISEFRHHYFAEAVQRFKLGELWWVMPHDEAKEQQESRRHTDAWEGPVLDYLVGRKFCLTVDIARAALDIKLERIGRIETLRIAAILRHHGWEPRVIRHGSSTRREWVPRDTPKAPPQRKREPGDDDDR